MIGFPLEPWTRQIVMKVEHNIMKFIFFEDMSMVTFDKWTLWVLVEMDIEKDLPVGMEIILGDVSFIQRLDHSKVHFWCSVCHQTSLKVT